ncbi:LpxL/LpxP family Kdo(2)-lipid IV(A) lauroyl/palmitoleoyl acyltransferase [Candidatus Williamhamiltonella defendens]|uniref:LpxL/LpxP family Kdo(2)-lipid IV(A) lauroyl/palmitoleoyl acyltransferase n=1 Tax=Candidatus Williamhamiltonella defendens TaxID=138072 RepID=UPI0016514A6B|nr:LpxL/LpxP family Kdo(2)-lipid IV(A) lauroyl/palmitoleoyl acyltransferase [Candidatus Hamiltonella defensa]
MIKKSPHFHLSFLHPRYWLTWFGAGFLYLLVCLPYPIIYRLGKCIGRLSMYFLRRRVNITSRNLELCFPEISLAERQKIVKKNFESLGIGLFESGMAWFWPDWRVKHWSRLIGLECVEKVQKNRQGILLIGVHFLTLEFAARILGLHKQAIGVYRPHNNKVINWIQIYGRTRSNKGLIDRNHIKTMILCLKKGEILWYLPDHDYGPRSSVFVPFFAVKQAATTRGTHLLLSKGSINCVPYHLVRLTDAKGYRMIISPALNNFPLQDETETATSMNKVIENIIQKAPEQYMWQHRRFKTRPKGAESLY